MDEEADDALLCASGDVSGSEGSSEAHAAAGQVSCTVCFSHISCVGLSPAGHLLPNTVKLLLQWRVSMILCFAYTSPTAMPSFVLAVDADKVPKSPGCKHHTAARRPNTIRLSHPGCGGGGAQPVAWQGGGRG